MIEWEQMPDAGHYGRLVLYACPVCGAVVGERAGSRLGIPLNTDARDKHAEWHGMTSST